SSRRRHTRFSRDWSSDVRSSDLMKLRRRVFAPEPSIGILLGEELHGQTHGDPTEYGGDQVFVVPAIVALSVIDRFLGHPGQSAQIGRASCRAIVAIRASATCRGV